MTKMLEKSDDSAAIPSDLPHQHSARVQAQHMGRRFRFARELNGLSGKEAAALLGYASSAQISQIEKGERPIPSSWGFVLKVAQAFGLSSDYLLGLSPNIERDPSIAQQFATMRSFQHLFEEHSAKMTTVLMRHCIRSDYSHMDVKAFCEQVRALADALRKMIQLNPEMDFEGEVRGGATIFALIAELENRHLPVAEKFAKRRLDSEMYLKQLAAGEAGPIACMMGERQQSLTF